jgi:hypothetical protein
MKIYTYFSLLVFALLSPGIVTGQTTTMPVLNSRDINDAVITETRTFGNESLFGYMDGGAELYLEYGFDSLFVTSLSFKGGDIKAEVFRMSDPDAAFGIYSVSHFKCTNSVDLTRYYCSSPYQVQFCKGSFYVSIINSNGTEAEQKLSESIAELLIGKISGQSFSPAVYITDDLTEEEVKSALFVRGSLGLFNGAYGLSKELEDFSGYSALIIKGEETRVAVRFNTVELMNAFVEKEKIDLAALKKGEEVTDSYNHKVSMICQQSLLLKINKQ